MSIVSLTKGVIDAWISEAHCMVAAGVKVCLLQRRSKQARRQKRDCRRYLMGSCGRFLQQRTRIQITARASVT